MDNIENYRKRFYSLMESTIGNVKPLINEGISPQQNQIVVSFEGCNNVGSLLLTLGGKDENGRIIVDNVQITKSDESGLTVVTPEESQSAQSEGKCPAPSYYEQYLKGGNRQINTLQYDRDWNNMVYTYDEISQIKWYVSNEDKVKLGQYTPEKEVKTSQESETEVETTPIDPNSIVPSSGVTKTQGFKVGQITGEVPQPTTDTAQKAAETTQQTGGFQLSQEAKINTTNDKAFDYALDNGKYYFKGKGSYAKKYPDWKEAKGNALTSIQNKVKF